MGLSSTCPSPQALAGQWDVCHEAARSSPRCPCSRRGGGTLPAFLCLTTMGQGRAAALDGSTGICAAKHSLGLRNISPPQTHTLTGCPAASQHSEFHQRRRKKPKVCPSFSWKAKQRPAGTLQPLHCRQTGPARVNGIMSLPALLNPLGHRIGLVVNLLAGEGCWWPSGWWSTATPPAPVRRRGE